MYLLIYLGGGGEGGWSSDAGNLEVLDFMVSISFKFFSVWACGGGGGYALPRKLYGFSFRGEGSAT